MTPVRPCPVRLFISYSHMDKEWMRSLLPLLDGFQYDARLSRHGSGLNFVHGWHDQILPRGTPWDREIRDQLEAMDIFVPLISHHFFGSEYIQEVELPEAERRVKAGELKVVLPIFLFEVDLRSKCPFLHQFTSLPPNRAWNRYKGRSHAHGDIDNGLWNAIERVLNSNGRPKR